MDVYTLTRTWPSAGADPLAAPSPTDDAGCPSSPVSRPTLDRAFDLALFILGDRAHAVDAVCRALARLESAATAQARRLSYAPRGRMWQEGMRPASRTRVLATDLQL